MLYSKDRHLFYKAGLNQETELRQLGATYLPKTDEWSLPPICSSIEQLKRSFGDSLVIDHQSLDRDGYLPPFGFKTDYNPNLEDRLFPYQKDAVQFLINSPHHGAILALSPGLGKTFTTIGAARILQARRILVVSPLSLVFNWISEIWKWDNTHAQNCYRTVPDGDGWFVTNYETVVRLKKEYLEQRFDLIIIDESIMVKNRKATRSKTMLAMSRQAKRTWLLSGSPVSKYADDLYMQLAIVEPRYFKSFWRFANTYCFIEKTIWGDKISGTRPTIDFRWEFRDLMFVRNQRQVLPDLPNVLFEDYALQMEPDQKAMYQAMSKEFILELESGDLTAATKVSQLIRLQQIVSCPNVFIPSVKSCKIKALDTLIDTQVLPLPAIIWVNFKQTAENLYKDLVDHHPELTVQIITGDSVDRASVFTAFQDGLVDVLILSIGVGKYGLTLTTAKSAVYYDKTFDGDAYLQSIARIHRIGLTHVPVIFTLKVPGTTDTLIEMNLMGKMQSIHAISNNDLKLLLKGLGQNEG